MKRVLFTLVLLSVLSVAQIESSFVAVTATEQTAMVSTMTFSALL